MQLSAEQLSVILEADLDGNASAMVNRPCKIEEGEEGAITFLANPKYEPYIYTTQASIVVVGRDFTPKASVAATLLRVDNVSSSFARLLSFYDSAVQARPVGVSPQAYVDASATLGEHVAVGRFSTIERGAVIGDNVVVFDHVYIGAGARIGAGSILFPGVRVMHLCELGQDCVLHPNVVVGADGFGFAPDAQGVYTKVPQVGKVVLENDVEVGAGTTIDRATMGVTRIGQGVKLDNLVQIGHNVEIGAHTVIAAQTGVAGSTKIGKHCRIGGQVGFVGHVSIADGTQIQAQSGVAGAVETPGQALFGSPAIPYKDYIRSYAVFKKLPELYRELHRLQQEVGQLRDMQE
ncbi:MAG: UDP-3-O-(3-hydroxymyristoyl)glucosamine N-acyltransferase [Saprospiraceae bacterium]